MKEQTAENTGCLMVAEFADDARVADESQTAIGQNVGTHIIASFLETENVDEAPKRFTSGEFWGNRRIT